MNSKKQLPKRFYETVSIEANEERFAIMLDGRRTKTPSKNIFTVPNTTLAEAVAEEWRSQGEYIDRHRMPITNFLTATIDSEAGAAREWSDEIIAYLNSDLLCYRAIEPDALVQRQKERWNPFLTWFERDFGITLNVTSGIVAIKQPDENLMTIRSVLQDQQPEIVFALKRTTALTGSAVLAFALWKQAFPSAEIFEASRLDERFQEERWGVDDEAKEREAQLLSEFHALEKILFSL